MGINDTGVLVDDLVTVANAKFQVYPCIFRKNS